MARQTFWKGYLKLSLVTAAVSLTPATTESNKVRFHVLNRQTKNRVESRYVDSVTHKPVAEKDEVKGYPRGEDDYVLLEDDEIEAVGLESTRTIDIDTFVPRGSIDWIWYDKPHFLAPEDKVGTEAFCVIREAMKANNVVGIARLVLYRRERAVLLEPQDKGIILWTLHYGEDVRDPAATLDMKSKVDGELLSLMKTLVKEETKDWSPSMVQDPIQKRLKTMIKSKQKNQTKAAPAAKREPVKSTGNVINIMDALKKSLAAEKSR
jgi:DNA end-binding protein Ku